MSKDKKAGVALRVGLNMLRDMLDAARLLPPDLRAACLPSIELALAEAIDLASLAQFVRSAPIPPRIAGIYITADGCLLRHLDILLDDAGWPTLQPAEALTHVVGSDLLRCYRAAARAATSPVVLLDSSTGSDAPSRVTAIDAAAVMRAVGGRRFHA